MSEIETDVPHLATLFVEVANALTLANIYLEGFVWITEPEFSELEHIRAVTGRALALIETVKAQAGPVWMPCCRYCLAGPLTTPNELTTGECLECRGPTT